MTVFTRFINQHDQGRFAIKQLHTLVLRRVHAWVINFIAKIRPATTAHLPAYSQPLNAILASLADATLMLNGRGEVIDCSAHLSVLCGYPAQSLIGCHLRVLLPDFYHSDSSTFISDYVALASHSGMPTWRQTGLRCLDGRRLTVRVHLATISPSQQQFMLLIDDVSAQAASHLAQQQQAAWCQQLLQQLSGVQFRCEANVARRLLFLDASASQLTGWPVSTFLTGNLQFWQSIVKEDRALHTQAMCQAMATQQCYQLEYRMRDRQGNHRWIKEIGHPVCDAGGQVLYMEGALFDVTLQHQESSHLHSMLDALQQAMPMARLTNCGVFIDATQVFLTQLGLRAWDIQGQPHQTILSAQYQDAPFQSQLWAQLSQGIAVEKNLHYDHPDGDCYVMRVHYLPVLDSQQQYSQVLMCLGAMQPTTAVVPSHVLSLVPAQGCRQFPAGSPTFNQSI